MPRQVSWTNADPSEARRIVAKATDRAQAPSKPPGPPYPPNTASLGGVPTVGVDVPITAVFLFLFVLGAIGHMTIFQLNMRRGHKFVMSGMMFGFCMARIVTCIMRIVWATRQTQVQIAMAAQIFVSAGVVLLFVVNLIFAQRIVRASHPNTGWHPFFAHAFTLTYVLIVLTLVIVITVLVQSFYTLNKHTKTIDRRLQLYGQTYYTVVAFAPIVLVIGGLIIPHKTRLEKFGNGRYRTKIIILLTSSVILTLGSAFRAGINYKAARPRNDPAWYHSKACFYSFNFLIELAVVIFYLLIRVDLRFHVPNGSMRAGDYSGRNLKEGRESSGEINGEINGEISGEINGKSTGEGGLMDKVLSEEEVFDEKPAPGLRTPPLATLQGDEKV